MQSKHVTLYSLHGHMAEIMTRITERAVLPYYLFVFIYIGVYSPFHPHPPETAIAALLKIVPIWYLMVYIYRLRSQNPQPLQALKAMHMSPDSITEQPVKTDERQASAARSSQGCFLASLVMSSIGDICLVYKYLFMAGIFCFGIAHVFNLLVLRRLYVLSSKAWLSVPMCFLMYAVLFSGINDFIFKIIVFMYAVLIYSMLFFAIAGYESCPCSSTLSSMLGASMFVISDFLIACNKWLMVTPHSEIMTRITERAVLPYYLFVFIYIGVYSPFHPHPPETAIAALLKIVPIWYLMVYIYRLRSQNPQPLQALKAMHMSPDSITEQPVKTDERQASAARSSQGCFLASLVMSSIGDICLVYKYLFMAGIFCFGIAHVFNLLVLRRLYVLSSKAWLSVPMCFLMYAVLFSGINDFIFKIIVFMYAVLIYSMLFFAIAGYESCPCSSTLSSMLGASMFVISDFLIACNKWLMVTPHSEVSILLTYYVAQLLLTISNC